MPSDMILLELCDPPMVMSQPICRRSRSWAFSVSSCPRLRIDPMFVSRDRLDAADDAAIGMLISASFVFLL